MTEPWLIPGWHPFVVHFPLALILTAVPAFTATALAPRARWAASLNTVGTVNLCVGAVALLFALGTGLAASIGLDVSEAAHQAIGAHMRAAMLAALLVLLLAVWRGAGSAPAARPSWLFVLLLWAAAAVLAVTGYRGAHNVYRYGVGVQCAASGAMPDAARTAGAAATTTAVDRRCSR